MPIFSVEETRAADKHTIEKGTPSKELLRRADDLIGKLTNIDIGILFHFDDNKDKYTLF